MWCDGCKPIFQLGSSWTKSNIRSYLIVILEASWSVDPDPGQTSPCIQCTVYGRQVWAGWDHCAQHYYGYHSLVQDGYMLQISSILLGGKFKVFATFSLGYCGGLMDKSGTFILKSGRTLQSKKLGWSKSRERLKWLIPYNLQVVLCVFKKTFCTVRHDYTWSNKSARLTGSSG